MLVPPALSCGRCAAGYNRAMQTLPQLLASLESRVSAAYVLAGPEGFLRSEAEGAIVRAVFGEDHPGPGFVPIDGLREGGDPVEPADVLDELRSVSLFAPRKVVSVRRADVLLKEHRDVFMDYLADPDPDSVLLLHVQNLAKKSAVPKKLEPFAVDCFTLYETSFGEPDISASSPLGKWIVRRAAGAHNIRLLPGGVVRLIELVGTNLGEIEGALKQLALAERAGDAPVSRGKVDEVVAPSRSYTQFRVAEFALSGRAADAFAAADACFEQGLPDQKGRVDHGESGVAVRLLWSVGREIEILHAARGLIDEGEAIGPNVGKLGIPPWKADAVERAARAVPLEALARALDLAFEADWAVKRGDADGRFAVERLILELGKVIRGEPAAAGR